MAKIYMSESPIGGEFINFNGAYVRASWEFAYGLDFLVLFACPCRSAGIKQKEQRKTARSQYAVPSVETPCFFLLIWLNLKIAIWRGGRVG